MKTKNLAIIYLLILTIGTIVSIYMPKVEAGGTEATMVIPDEAIRLRILANSDKEEDQAVKRLIRDEVNADITGWVKELTSLDEAREVIQSHLPDIQETAREVIRENGLEQSVTVDFGQAEFPTKLYGQFLYPAGEYEAVIITLGDGEGANWWCVLFPPLCFLDFSNGTAVSQSPIVEEEPKETVNAEKAKVSDTVEETKVQDKDEKTEELTEKGREVEDEESVDGKLTASAKTDKQVYDGENESEVEVKSLFMEIFHEIF
ncbi:stage II sporulation protein R [Peribacillus sp. NPDC097675]|uniref:stage II sporulation protein R n=1 Tax=Peribacillus sp. NPDC097675 TaxID=3390618 RepID=UPI003CFDF42C